MWLEAEFPMPEEEMDAFEGILLMHGIESWERLGGGSAAQLGDNYDYADSDIFRAAPAVRVVLENGTESRELLSAVAAASGVQPLLRLQDEREWSEEWKKFYHPLEIGERLCVCPAWEQYAGQGRAVCLVEPGGVFGTGLHQSTQLCLQFLERHVRGGEKVLDLGCGSGILGIAALKLGASQALGVDIEPQAEEAALHNAELNGVSERFSVRVGDVAQDGALLADAPRCDIVIANIVADVIIMLAPVVSGCLADNGLFIASGIIDSRLEEVRAALRAQGFDIIEQRSRDNWYALLLKRQ